MPLATLIGPEAAQDMIQRQKAKIQAQIDAGTLSKGLQAQYKVQLERLESSRNGDCEIMMFPGAITPSCKRLGTQYSLQTEKFTSNQRGPKLYHGPGCK